MTIITREGMEKIISSYYNVETRVFDLSSLKCNMVTKNLIEYQTSKYNSERVIFSHIKTYIYTKPTFNIRENIPSTIGHDGLQAVKQGIKFIDNYFNNNKCTPTTPNAPIALCVRKAIEAGVTWDQFITERARIRDPRAHRAGSARREQEKLTTRMSSIINASTKHNTL